MNTHVWSWSKLAGMNIKDFSEGCRIPKIMPQIVYYQRRHSYYFTMLLHWFTFAYTSVIILNVRYSPVFVLTSPLYYKGAEPCPCVSSALSHSIWHSTLYVVRARQMLLSTKITSLPVCWEERAENSGLEVGASCTLFYNSIVLYHQAKRCIFLVL